MIRLVAFASLLLGLAGSSDTTPAARALARLNGLVGDWNGTVQWLNTGNPPGKARATYSRSGNGTAVIESLYLGDDSEPAMTSVYHLDGTDLRMTHFCVGQNQPRLKAAEIDEAKGVIRFTFVDGTSLKEHPAHVHGAELRFVGDDRLVIEFTVEGGARTQTEHLELVRTR